MSSCGEKTSRSIHVLVIARNIHNGSFEKTDFSNAGTNLSHGLLTALKTFPVYRGGLCGSLMLISLYDEH